MSFTNLAPVLPSEIPCHFQDFRSVVQREKSSDLLLPICHIEHPISFDPEATIETIACDVQGKEIVVPNATIQRYEFLLVPKLKLLELTFIKMLYDSDYNFGNVIKSCEKLERKKFFRHGGFLFDKTHEPINDVLINFDKFSSNPNASQLAESFFGEIVYYDNVRVFRKHLDDHTETLKFNIDDLSKKLFVCHNKYIFCTYNFLFRAFESALDIQKDSKVIFTPGYRFWIRMKEKRLPSQKNSKPMLKGDCQLRVKEQINAYKICLQGEQNSSFSFSNLARFRADFSDLRSNPFQVGEDDMTLTSKATKETQEQEEQLGPHKKKSKEQLEAEEKPGKEPEAAHLLSIKLKAKESSKYTTLFNTKTRAILSLLLQPPWL